VTGSLRMDVDFDRIYRAIVEAATAAVNTTAIAAEDHARKRAPVRKIFRAGPAQRRFQSLEELLPYVGIRSRLGLPPMGPVKVVTSRRNAKHALIPTLRIEGIRTRADFRRVSPRNPRELALSEAEGALSGRGRYEVRSGRALTKSGRVGGTLRREIRTIPASAGQHPYLHAAVISPTPYAKYVEFGTRHAAAQPFLRPALAMVKGDFKKEMRRALNNVGRYGR